MARKKSEDGTEVETGEEGADPEIADAGTDGVELTGNAGADPEGAGVEPRGDRPDPALAALTQHCKAWIRKEIELRMQGVGIEEREEANP